MLGSLKVIRSLYTTIPKLMPRGGKANAGIGRQLLIYNDLGKSSLESESFDDMESDFMDVHKSHKQLEMEEMKRKEKIKQYIIKHKYFREPKLPNLLTYAEKEQIRLLNSRDPEEWSVERLAESFPATPEIIKKILNAKWKANSVKRIQAHDEMVIRNWELFNQKDSKFCQAIPLSLREHLQKFAKRSLKDLKNITESPIRQNWPIGTKIPKPNSQEFQMIVGADDIKGSTKPKENIEIESGVHQKGKIELTNEIKPNDLEDESYLLSKVVDKRKMRLEEAKRLKLGLEELPSVNASSFSNVNVLNKNAIQRLENPNGTGVVVTNMTPNDVISNFDSIVQYETQEIEISKQDQQRYEITKIKERIYIPRKLRARGSTFKVEDCYYDSDGEFLYRVPGMTK